MAGEPGWKIAPALGIDMGGAVPIPFSSIPDGSKGTPRLTPNLGLGFQYSLNNKWNIVAEVNYHILSYTAMANVRSQPFWSDDRSYSLYFSGEAHSSTELRFVEFPVLACLQPGEHWSLVFGGYYSRMIEGTFETEGKNGWISANKEDTDTAPLPGTQSTNYDFSEELDRFDWGALIGYQYKISPRILFWGRFHWGFKSIFKQEFQNIDYEMYQLRLSTGISFTLFKG